MSNDFLVVSLEFAHLSLDLDTIDTLTDQGVCSVCFAEVDVDDAWVVASPMAEVGGFIQDPCYMGWLAGQYIAMLTHKSHIEKCKEEIIKLKPEYYFRMFSNGDFRQQRGVLL